MWRKATDLLQCTIFEQRWCICFIRGTEKDKKVQFILALTTALHNNRGHGFCCNGWTGMTVFVARHKFQRYNAQPNGVLNVYVVIKKSLSYLLRYK